MKLLVTRPQPGADATAKRVLAAGHQPSLMPLFALGAVPWGAPDASGYDASGYDASGYDALLFTSGNAVRLAGEGLAQYAYLPAYAVGTATARAAEQAGLNLAATGEADAKALLPMAHDAGHQRLLWLAGKDRIALPPTDGLSIDAITVYASEALPAPADFAERLADADAALLHSPRAAAHFAWLCDTHNVARDGVVLAAFSQAISDAAGGGWRTKRVSPTPNDAALLSLLASGPTV